MALDTTYTPNLPVYKGKVDTDSWFLVRLVDRTDGITQETGVAHGSMDVDIAAIDGSTTLGAYSVGATEWYEIGEGMYGLKLGASEFTAAGTYAVRVGETGTTARKFSFMVEVVERDVDDVSVATGMILGNTTHGGAAATLSLLSMAVTNTGGSAVTFTSSSAGSHGLVLQGNTTGHGMIATGGATGDGMRLNGGSTSGSGLNAIAPAGNDNAIKATGQGTGAAMKLTGGASGPGLYAIAGASGDAGAIFEGTGISGDGILCTLAGSGKALNATNITAIETDTQDIQSRLPSALVGGRMITNVQAWNGTTVAVGSTSALPKVDAQAISDSTAAADSVQANIGNLDAAVSDTSTLTQTQVTGGAYALDTDANGRIRIVDGTGTGELDTTSGLVNLNLAQSLPTGQSADTTGLALEKALDNLDVVLSTRSAPATAQTINLTTALSETPTAGSIGDALLHQLAQLKYRNKSTGNGGTLKTYLSDGTTVLTSRTISSDGLELTT